MGGTEGVAGRVFKWRGLIAHGKEVLEDYLKPIRFKFEPVELFDLPLKGWTAEMLCCESALFLLIASLRRIIFDGLLPTVGNKRALDRWITS